jgi:hypothetical protein
LDPGGALFAPPFPISPRVPIGLFEMRSLRTMLPPPSSLRLEAVVEHCRAVCSPCLFGPLFGSLLKFSSGHFRRPRFCFPLLIALFTLCRELFAISHLFCLGSLSPRTISALFDSMGRKRADFFGRAREKDSRQQKRHRRDTSPQRPVRWNKKTI